MVKENQSLLNKLNIATDIILTFASMLLAYWFRHVLLNIPASYGLGTYLRFTLLIVPLHLIIYSFFDLYGSFRTKRFYKEAASVIQANTILLALLIVLLFVFKYVHISRWVLVIFGIFNTILISGKRYLLRKLLSSARMQGYNLKHVVIVGAGRTARDYLDTIQKKREFGYHYTGYIAGSDRLGEKRLGGYSDLYRVLNDRKPDEVVCALDISESEHLKQVIADCEKTGSKVSIIPFCYKYISSRPYIDQLENIPLINVRRIPLDNMGNAFLKRGMDIIGSLILILLSSPLMLFAAVGVKLTSRGPVIFKQKRVGLNKKLFTMYKFRSMKLNTESGTAWSKNADPRKTKFGSFLRKFSIDELPQFYNVLKGDMSLVGPRPEIPFFVDSFQEQIPLYMVKHQVKPGITGLAQVRGYRGDTSIEKRIECDIEYIENWNLLLDIQILLQTAFKAFKNDEQLVK